MNSLRVSMCCRHETCNSLVPSQVKAALCGKGIDSDMKVGSSPFFFNNLKGSCDKEGLLFVETPHSIVYETANEVAQRFLLQNSGSRAVVFLDKKRAGVKCVGAFDCIDGYSSPSTTSLAAINAWYDAREKNLEVVLIDSVIDIVLWVYDNAEEILSSLK